MLKNYLLKSPISKVCSPTNKRANLYFALTTLLVVSPVQWSYAQMKPRGKGKLVTKACANVYHQLNPSPFEPSEVLRLHGLEPEKLRFTANLTYLQKKKREGVGWGITWGIRAFYLTEEVGVVNVGKSWDGDSLQISWVETSDAFRGKGLGTLLYLTAAKIGFDSFGLVLEPSSESVTDAARAVWNNLADQKFAVPSGVRMDRHVLSGTALNAVSDFFYSHVQNDQSAIVDRLLKTSVPK